MTFYPCFDWTKDMIIQEVKAAKIKLPRDYLMMSRTMAAIPSYRHLLRMETMFPEDFRRVESMFPMVRAELARMAFRDMKAVDISKAKADHGKVREHTAGKNESPSTGGQK